MVQQTSTDYADMGEEVEEDKVFYLLVEQVGGGEVFNFRDLGLYHGNCHGGEVTLISSLELHNLSCRRCENRITIARESSLAIAATAVDGRERNSLPDDADVSFYSQIVYLPYVDAMVLERPNFEIWVERKEAGDDFDSSTLLKLHGNCQGGKLDCHISKKNTWSIDCTRCQESVRVDGITGLICTAIDGNPRELAIIHRPKTERRFGRVLVIGNREMNS